MYELLEIKNEYFHIINKVYKLELNLNLEIKKYQLIKKYLKNIPKYERILLKCLTNFKINDDPFLIEIEDNTLIKVDEETSNKYNKIIKFIKNKLLNIKNIDIHINSSFKNEFINLSYENIKFSIFLPHYDEKYKNYIFAALLRYDILVFLNNMSTAVKPTIYNELKNSGTKVELFGSFFNTFLPYYFGLFYDLEFPFGCIGNLFTSELKYGKFVANPPFDIKIMNKFFYLLRENLDNNKIEVYVTIPLWYVPDRIEFNKIKKEQIYIQDKNDLDKDILEKYIKKNEIYSQKEYSFLNYILKKNMHLCDVNVFIVSSL
jgi:hypothetical protein